MSPRSAMFEKPSPNLGRLVAIMERLRDPVTGCEWEITSGDFAEVQRLGGFVAATDIVVYYVNRFATPGLLGCGGHLPGRPACILAASAARYSTAHEVGHVMLGSSFSPVHDSAISNLMYAYENRTGDPPSLNDRQLMQMKRSPCCPVL